VVGGSNTTCLGLPSLHRLPCTQVVPLATHLPPETRKQRNAVVVPRPSGVLDWGHQSRPNHHRRGLHGEQQELHQGPVGAVHLPPSCISTSIPDLPTSSHRKRYDSYSCFFPNYFLCFQSEISQLDHEINQCCRCSPSPSFLHSHLHPRSPHLPQRRAQKGMIVIPSSSLNVFFVSSLRFPD
jgi:hypothetical protein